MVKYTKENTDKGIVSYFIHDYVGVNTLIDARNAYFIKSEEIETAFLSHWKPFVLSLSSEEDRALAFKLFYEWQTSQMDTFLEFLKVEQPRAVAA